MSANNELIVAPFPGDLDKYAVWYNGCVDNPFDFSQTTTAIFDTFEEAYRYADDQNDWTIEYGVRVILREKMEKYEMQVWDEFPDYTFLHPMGPLTECTSSLHDD